MPISIAPDQRHGGPSEDDAGNRYGSLGAFAVPGVAGADEDVFACSPISLGPATACTFSSALLLDGSAWGLAGLGVDAFELA